MQDMSGITTEQASSPPRTLVADVTINKSATEQAQVPNKTKDTPKKKLEEAPVEANNSVQQNIPVEGNNFVCRMCDKVFESHSALEKHILFHNADKIFFCKMCDLSFNTSAGLHRHIRSHKQNLQHDTDSEDSDSNMSKTSPRNHQKKRKLEYNNNEKPSNGCGGSSADDEQGPAAKRKPKTINNNFLSEATTQQNLPCPVCSRKNFESLASLEAHVEEVHPDYQVKCTLCNLSFKNHRILNLHNLMVHRPDRKSLTSKKIQSNSISGFKDCTFIDFSSEKFPQIAKEMCEKSVHKSVTDQKFRCEHCARDFPCESALNIHIKTCFPSISGERDYFSKPRRESSSAEEDARRDDFFANLNLQNASPKFIPNIRPIAETAKLNISSDFYAIRNEPIRPLVDNTKDLADIQSILSVASSGSLFEQLTNKSKDIISRTQDLVPKANDENEEVQDAFASEFRKMKLRGEFPCRLCTAIFPNLRALKGHNRVHLSGNGPGPYRCNMCPHSSLDKAALVRHMRTHNGDRPYECSVCNYAFTTKANCERHLRNRHSKVTREEVKRSIIYHPSEDPNNDEVNSKLNISRDDIKRSSIIYTPPENDRREDRNERSTPVSHFVRDTVSMFSDNKIPLPLQRELPLVIPQPRTIHPQYSLDSLRPNLPITPEDIIQARIQQGKAFGQLKQIPEFDDESDIEKENDSDGEVDAIDDSYPNKSANYSEAPMDLSTGDFQDDVLDLSKKKSIPDNAPDTPNSENDDNFVQKSTEFNNNHAAAVNVFEKTQQILLAQQQLMKDAHLHKIDPTAFYANQLTQLYRAGAAFPGLGLPPGFPLHPYLLPPNFFLNPPSNSKELADMKEKFQKDIIMGLQLSGGGLVGMDHNNIVNNMTLASERLQAFHQHSVNNINNNDSKCSTPTPPVKTEEECKPLLQINTETPTSTAYANPIPMLPSPKILKKEPIATNSPNSVKMVIKNGVLMPKQKQRRYRTERPFSCEHCSARFTLRSNMERHIKQQHPQYWSQRQRSNIGIPRKSPISMVPQNITVPPLNYENHLNYIKNSSLSDEEKDVGLSGNKACSMISDQVKYAILTQQLKTQSSFSQDKTSAKPDSPRAADNEEEDEDDALIIDEEEDMEDMTKDKHQEENEDINLKAKKVAQEILIGVASKSQNDIVKDFDWKITGNLISKNPLCTITPTTVNEINMKENEKSENIKINEHKQEEGDLVSVSRLLDNAVTQIPFGKYFKNDFPTNQVQNQLINSVGIGQHGEGSEEDEEGLVAPSSSTSEGNNSGSDENRSESEATTQVPQKKKSAYSLAPNRVPCPYCHREFPWSSSLRRHVLTHTGQKPYKCPHCPLLFTTKSNCDRHLLRKHGSHAVSSQQTIINPMPEVSPPNIPIPALGNQVSTMRNVPERPYKCASCPSSTFSTLSNLKKHMSSKHCINIPDADPNSPKHEENQSRPNSRGNEQTFTSDDEKSDHKDVTKSSTDSSERKSEWESQISSKYGPSFTQDTPSNIQNTELPFKCHLCDNSFAERQEALDHIKELHTAEFELLISKGALETSINFTDELSPSTPGHRSEGGEDQGGEESGEHQRGKFPDYTNRKVVCAFCMRRFWSAEDLRRHMRTHSGERPFSCDVCRRRFTLKHSMLRHRKKHAHTSTSGEEMDLSTASGDEENNSTMPQNFSSSSGSTASPINSSYQSLPNSSTPISSKNPLLTLSGYQLALTKNLSPDVPNNVNNNNSPPAQNYKGRMQLKNVNLEEFKRSRYSSEDNDAQDSEVESGNDLIGNLLGLDRTTINKVLSSPDEAAKLLGVNK